MEILNEQKKKIAEDLRNYVENVAGGSQNKASKLLSGVSNAYISHILKNNWDMISDEAWRNIQKQVSKNGDWVFIKDTPYLFMNKLIADAAETGNTYGIIGYTGVGKTSTTDHTDQANLFTLKCNEYFTAQDFLLELLKVMGLEPSSSKVSGLMKQIVKHLLRVQKPVIVIDEADKLQDKVLFFFISLYNALEGKCGLIIQATSYLKKRIDTGLEKNKKGYQEINSRIGGTFFRVPKPTRLDVINICRANGITDEMTAVGIYNSSNGDKRIVKRLVHAHLKTAQ